MDISFGNGNSILKLLRGVSHSQIEFGVSDKKQIRFILTQNGNAIPVHFKFFRVSMWKIPKSQYMQKLHIYSTIFSEVVEAVFSQPSKTDQMQHIILSSFCRQYIKVDNSLEYQLDECGLVALMLVPSL